MKALTKASLTLALAGLLALPTITISAKAISDVATVPTNYTKASDVEYVKNNGKIANWGAKEEDCTFLTTYATDFYTGNYVYEALSNLSGGSSTSTAPQSPLYKKLQTLMKDKHSHITNYDETKDLYKYTDCVRSDTTQLVSFYSGTMTQGHWGSGGKPWNREHTWPNSKGLDGSDENDIMMLRPTLQSENDSRGNTAYGLSSGYHVPAKHVRGDCARITLYVYTRWGNTGKMWGKDGVIESVDVLLQWMKEDPVDTWEMGRNDAVQAITGTRNVFVDYPEYAWLLFGEDIPNDVVTPSGKAKTNGTGSNGGTTMPDNGGETTNPDGSCKHEYGSWFLLKEPTETEEGLRKRFCSLCQEEDVEVIPKVGSEGAGVSCTSSVYTAAASILFALGGAYVLKERMKTK